MYGYATIKSHVLKRQEKGLFGISLPRLLGCGLGASALYSAFRIALPDQAIVFGLVSFVGALALTATRGGIPRWRLMLLGMNWWLVTRASRAPKAISGQIAIGLGFPVNGIYLDTDALFGASESDTPTTELTDWVSYAQPLMMDPSEPGLTLQATPHLQPVKEHS